MEKQLLNEVFKEEKSKELLNDVAGGMTKRTMCFTLDSVPSSSSSTMWKWHKCL